MSYFNYCRRHNDDVRPKFHRLFGGPPREPGELDHAEGDGHRRLHPGGDGGNRAESSDTPRDLTGSANLVMAGGVALNCVANGRLLREGPFDEIWVQPAAGDAGGALGAALLVWHGVLDNPEPHARHRFPAASLLGPALRRPRISSLFLDSTRRCDTSDSETRTRSWTRSRLIDEGR